MNVSALIAHSGLEIRQLVKRWDVVFFSIVMPLAVMYFFGTMFSTTGAAGTGSMAYKLPGYIVMAAMSVGLSALGFMLSTERQFGILKRLGATPLSRSMLLLSKMVASSLIVTAATAVLLAFGVFYYGVDIKGNLGGAAIVITLGVLVFSIMGLTVAGLMQSDAAAATTNGIYLIMTVLGGTLFPMSQMPELVQQVGKLTPSYHFMEALTGVMAKGGSLMDVSGNLLVLAAWGTGLMFAAVRTFSWE